ncbi:reverse transcriptase domain-containing protein [Tanacetum coccineum]|uniref:Reverse transcriptase domain-containing protein n=1 Tax=Tanacetum coccineum TaxID=301880 RepID=A0ABQ4YEA6_9ASTR
MALRSWEFRRAFHGNVRRHAGSRNLHMRCGFYTDKGNFKDPAIVYRYCGYGAVSNSRFQPELIAILPVFRGREEPYAHLREFFSIADTYQIKLRPSSHLSNQVVFTHGLKCNPREQFHEAFNSLKELLRTCPHHDISKWELVKVFYDGLDYQNQRFVMATSGADRSTKIPRGILEDVIVKVDDFYYPVDFFVMDTESPYKDVQPTIILGRPSSHDLIVELWTMDIALSRKHFEVVKKEVLKWLDVGIIYPISDSKWVSPTQMVPKKVGITVVETESREKLTTRPVTGWRVCIDYRKLEYFTSKDHFPLPFIDQIVEKLSGQKFYCFLDGYFEVKKVPDYWSKQQRQYFFSQLKYYFWEDPELYKVCADQVVRRCVPDHEHTNILAHCHSYACGGHFGATKTGHKVLQSGFFWSSDLYNKDAQSFVKACTRCQQVGGISRRDQMPMNPILVVEIFDVWGIDFMGPFPTSYGNVYILVAVDYVSKWVEAEATKTNDHSVVLKFVKKNIFARHGIPKAIISDGGSHFKNFKFGKLLKHYGVNHKIATPYYPQD